MTWADVGAIAHAAANIILLIRIQHQYRTERQP